MGWGFIALLLSEIDVAIDHYGSISATIFPSQILEVRCKFLRRFPPSILSEEISLTPNVEECLFHSHKLKGTSFLLVY
jgi:hypothetical protein